MKIKKAHINTNPKEQSVKLCPDHTAVHDIKLRFCNFSYTHSSDKKQGVCSIHGCFNAETKRYFVGSKLSIDEHGVVFGLSKANQLPLVKHSASISKKIKCPQCASYDYEGLICECCYP